MPGARLAFPQCSCARVGTTRCIWLNRRELIQPHHDLGFRRARAYFVIYRMSDLAWELENLGGADITAALEELPAPSFVLDRAGVIRWLNAAARAENPEAEGQSWAAMVSPEQSGEAGQALTRIVCSGEPTELSVDLPDAGGQMVPREISTAPLRDGDTVVGVFGVATPSEPLGLRPADPGEHGLTERQLEILALLARGKSTSQIAEELYLSKTTVRNHIARILAALGVHSRVQAIIRASRAGLIRVR